MGMVQLSLNICLADWAVSTDAQSKINPITSKIYRSSGGGGDEAKDWNPRDESEL